MNRHSSPWLLGAALLLTFHPAIAQRVFSDDSGAQFTAEQATRGQAAYGRVCVSCHGAGLEGRQFGPTLKGDVFTSHWRGRTRAAFSEQIRSTMPPRGLGSVSGQAFTDIEAYILQTNGLAAQPSVAAVPASPPAAAPSVPVGQAPEGRPRPP